MMCSVMRVANVGAKSEASKVKYADRRAARQRDRDARASRDFMGSEGLQ